MPMFSVDITKEEAEYILDCIEEMVAFHGIKEIENILGDKLRRFIEDAKRYEEFRGRDQRIRGAHDIIKQWLKEGKL